MASVTLTGVSKRFTTGGYAVRELDLTIADGEFLCLVGPSGCGKSTTLNVIAGLEQPTSGTVRIGGTDVTRLSPRERDLAMVFQSYALYPHLDVRSNLAFPLKVARVAPAELRRRVEETAELLGITSLLERKPRELSGGQRQRVALGRALVRRPAAFLFDEPLSNLDANLRAQMRGELKKLHETVGGTFIYVTHDQAEAMTLSDRVALMNDGRLEQLGTARELYENPRSLFAARFFGAPTLNVCPPAALGLPSDAHVLVGLRPEHLTLDARARLQGRVYLVESMGADAWVTVELASTRVIARCEGAVQLRPGDPVGLHFDPQHLRWFDAASGLSRS
ncbi:MAG: ABC transporter ATP-binding protein [Archangium sp.]|nr:ABC transporter ATP-binding protein [Archangium sp.]MDP3574007.1 ABC transporter ATP-binding protein [Archangium sp.]